MLSKIASVIFFCVLLIIVSAKSDNDKLKFKATVSVQATNNTQVPSVTYIADAVECLEEAYSIYEDDENRATLYAALFEEKHKGTWNVVVGYSVVYVHSKVYIETVVLDGEENKYKDSSDKEKLFLIFSSN